MTAVQSAGPRNRGGTLEARYAVNRRTVFGALAEPAHARSLRIEVHQRGPLTADCKACCEIAGDRRLAYAPFRIENDDALHACSDSSNSLCR
jgi:hypothetical protein